MCNCNNFFHRALTVTYNGTNVALTFTDSTDIGSKEPFNIAVYKPVSSTVTGAPVPVVANINGVATVPLRDAYGLPLMSNKVPRGKTCGTYIVDDSGETPDIYVILKTPCYA
jgi:hypothetical protein